MSETVDGRGGKEPGGAPGAARRCETRGMREADRPPVADALREIAGRPEDVRRMDVQTLAYIGDAIYEVAVRLHVLQSGSRRTDQLHRQAIRYVGAAGQASVSRMFLRTGLLTPEETAVLKRARNHKTATRPKNADPLDYRLATGFEALIGCLFLQGNTQRLTQLMEIAIRFVDERESARTDGGQRDVGQMGAEQTAGDRREEGPLAPGPKVRDR